MSTSANVVEFRIRDKTGKEVGTHSQHMMCKTHWDKLLVFLPWNEHTIQAHGLDEEEATWEDTPVNLRLFLINKKVIPREPTDPPEHVEVFGSLVPYCCDGKVKEVLTYEAQAHKYAVDAPALVDKHYACMKCNRTLPAHPKPARPDVKRLPKPDTTHRRGIED